MRRQSLAGDPAIRLTPSAAHAYSWLRLRLQQDIKTFVSLSDILTNKLVIQFLEKLIPTPLEEDRRYL